jgi:hypothetical protein
MLTSANQIDIGFVQIPSGEYPGIQSIPLPPINAVCVMHIDDVLASKEVVTLDDLHERRSISLNSNNPLQRRITSAMETRGVVSLSFVETTAAHSACGIGFRWPRAHRLRPLYSFLLEIPGDYL